MHWAGWQNDTAPFFALADVFVCPSRHEPLGNVILEAWQHRLPVLSTHNEGARELVREGENALLAQIADPAGLADGLQRLLAPSPAARQRLADAGHETVQREHSEQGVVSAYLAMYEGLRRQAWASLECRHDADARERDLHEVGHVRARIRELPARGRGRH